MVRTLKNVLLVTSEFPPQPGGIGNHAHHLAKHLQLSQFKVKLISDQRSETGLEEHAFDATLAFEVYRVAKTKFRFIMYLKRIQLVFKLIKNSQTVMASGKFSLWVVAFASLFYNRTFVAIVHGTEVNFKSFVLKRSINLALKRFTKIIAVSNYTKSLIDHLNHNNVSVIPNGLDFLPVGGQVSKWETKTQKPMAIKGHPKLITVGNVSERKGQLNVIKLIPEILQTFPELQYHCVGIPTEAERFLKVARALNVEGHVTFHGKVDDERLRQFILASDVFVMLSSATATGDVEGFGIAILEANAFGVPAIGALGCGIEDAIHDGKSGLLIQHDDAKAFITALQQLLDHKTEFSKEAKAWAQGHDWKLIIKKYIEVIEGVMRTEDGGRVTDV